MSAFPARWDQRGARIVGALVLVASVLAVAGIARTVSLPHGLAQPYVATAFLVFISIGEFIRVTLPGDRESAPLGLAGALGYALLTEFGPTTLATQGFGQVIAVTVTGILIGALPHLAAGRPPQVDAVSRRIIVVSAVAIGFRATGLRDFVASLPMDSRWAAAGVMVALVVLGMALDTALATSVVVAGEHAPFGVALRDEARAMVGLGSAVGATGVLIALSAAIMGVWSLPVLAMPLFLTQFSFRRYSGIRQTYLETIRSLSRVTDVGGYTETGHGRRVSELSVAVARELGMPETGLRELEYAALLHDIGQLSLSEPIPRGATLMVPPSEQRRIAGLGAQVIREAGVLDRVAEIVEKQAEPYRQGHTPDDPSIPLSSRIIRVVNAYDDMVAGSLEFARRMDALEHLRMGLAAEYDPKVVDRLSHVVQRYSRMGV
ncbi:MAG: HD-GYP domain-containing protein [Actinomycetes bacterium]